VPVVLDLLPEPPALRHGASGRVQVAIDGALAVCERIAIGSPRTVAAVFVATTALSLVGAWGLHIETDFRARLSPDNPVRVDGDWFDERFAGANVLPLYLDVGAGGALDPGVLTAVAALQAELVAMPEIDAAFSLADVLSEVHGALRGAAGEQESSLPATRAAAAQELLLFEMSGGDGVERVVDGERGRLPVVLRLDAEAFRHTAAVGRAVEAAAARHLPGAEAVATSLGALIGGWLDSIVTGQRNGLGFSVLVIALMMAGGLRSLRVGIASMLPNLLPLLVIAGWIGFTWVAADSDTFVVLLLAIGIGVDDTIHFLVRLRVERLRGTAEQAIARTFAFAGRAIVMTTVILVCGFAPLAGSDYFTIRMLGTLLPAALVVALLADVLLVPAMVRLGWIRWD
jgi:predicted RND superfamily exporter protein